MNGQTFHAVSAVCRQIGWPPPEIVDTTGSTNDDLVGTNGHGRVLVALDQTAGHGRLDRRWVTRAGEALTFSVRLDVPPTVPDVNWGWIPLLAGLAVLEAVHRAGARTVGLKWPNDLVTDEGKLAGILVVADERSAVVGVGLNLHFAGQRPDPGARSLSEHGGDEDPDRLLADIVGSLQTWWQRWVAAAGDADRCGLRQAYTSACLTVGADVEVAASDAVFSGHAAGVDDLGRLLVDVDGQVRPVAAGDVSLSGRD